MPVRWLGPVGLAATALLAAGAAKAETVGRDLCADRPGLGTPACTVDRGTAVFELGIADWTRTSSPGTRADELLAGDVLLRVGLSHHLELQLGWTAFGTIRVREAGQQTGAESTGDLLLALRQNFYNPDGTGFSAAIMPYATLPTGGQAIGAGDWGAGLLLPLSADLGGISLAATPRIDAVVNESGRGRHLGYGTVTGIDVPLAESLSFTAELSLYRDRDPDRHSTETLFGLSLGWQPGADHQWDIGASFGLNRESPDLQLGFGYVRRF